MLYKAAELDEHDVFSSIDPYTLRDQEGSCLNLLLCSALFWYGVSPVRRLGNGLEYVLSFLSQQVFRLTCYCIE